MKYNELIKIKEGYNDVFDMAFEQKGYWKNFVTNKKFEDNLIKILRVFNSPVDNDHKSIWVQGTYGTGKSHSTSVVKHLLSDPLEEINDFINNLMNKQLRSELLAFRNKKRIFPVVIKGNHNISEAIDMNSVIQTEVKKAFKQAGIELSVKSDFDTILKTLSNPNFSSIVNDLITHDLSEYVSTKEELFEALRNEDIGILKIINHNLKQYNLHSASNNIVTWLTEVRNFIRSNSIADDLVIFWDEFTSLLSISERKSIYSLTQDIAEISTTHDGGVYMFLITHISYESTDVYKDMSSNEKEHIRDRFIVLPYEIHYDTTYTILYSAMERIKPDELSKLVDDRIKRNLEVEACLDSVVSDTVDPADSKNKLYGLYPFHPYTAYISTFLARIIGSSERSVFNFLNDKNVGFLAFTNNEIEKVPFLTIDVLWDFFFDKFKENPKYTEIVEIYRKNMDTVKNKGSLYFSVFKSILLLNIMQSTAGTDEETDERNLTSPSITNIERAFSGTVSSSKIESVLQDLDDMGIIQKTPDDRYEFAVSSTPREKIDSKLVNLKDKYATVSDILSAFSASSEAVKKEITESTNLKRPSLVEFFGANWKESNVTSKLDVLMSENPGIIIVAMFMHLGFPVSDNNSELSLDDLKSKLIELSSREKYKNVVFLQLDNIVFEQRRYNGFLDNLARSEIATESGSSTESAQNKAAASKWVKQFIDQLIDNGNVQLIFNGSAANASFSDVPGKITTKILPAIYKYGLDSLKIIKNTVWKIKQKPQDKSIAKMFANNRTEINSQIPTNLNDLLMNNANQYVFDEEMNLIPEMEETPVTKLCNEVKKIMDEHINDTSFDSTNYFDFIFQPPYGYIMTDASMGAVALAFRPYIGKMFVAESGSSIDSLKMVKFVGALFDHFLKGKDDPVLTVRFSSKDERDLMDLLISTFALEKKDSDGLLNIKWNLRDKFKRDNKAPLWILKYIPKENSKLSSLFDSLFEFTQKQNEDIDEKLVKTLLKEVKDKRLEIVNAINEVKKIDCMQKFVQYKLDEANQSSLDKEECIKHLSKSLPGEIVFWSEKDVIDEIIRFIDDQVNPKIIPDDDLVVIDPVIYVNKANEFTEKISDSSVSKDNLIEMLKKYIENKPASASELLNILNKIKK